MNTKILTRRPDSIDPNPNSATQNGNENEQEW